jgi:hypothetical protein
MGLFVSRLLSNDMRTLEQLMSEIASAVRSGQIEQLLLNDAFWALAQSVSSSPSALGELRGYVSGLLEEDWRTAAMLLDLISPGLLPTQRRFAVSLLKLESMSRALRSDVFWSLLLDRTWLTALWKYANGRRCSPEEEARLGLNSAAAAGANPLFFRKQSRRNGTSATASTAVAS